MSKRDNLYRTYEEAFLQAGFKVGSSQLGRCIIWKDLDTGYYYVSCRLPKFPGRWMVAADFKDGCYYHD